MAQQIQFIQLTQSQYDGLAEPTSNKLYFTTDTHRIYKGEDLYAATEFDQLNFTNISASGITVNGSNVSLEGHTHLITDVADLNGVLTGITATDISKTNGNFTGTVSASAIVAFSLTVGGSAVALSGHTHSKADISDFSHTHAISEITNLSESLTGITQTNITKTGTVSAATVRGTTGSFSTVSAGTVSAATGSFSSTLKVGGVNVALVGHSHSAADLSGITFNEMSVSSIEVSDLTVNGKRVSLVGHTHSFADLMDANNDVGDENANLTVSNLSAWNGTVGGQTIATQNWVTSAINGMSLGTLGCSVVTLSGTYTNDQTFSYDFVIKV